MSSALVHGCSCALSGPLSGFRACEFDAIATRVGRFWSVRVWALVNSTLSRSARALWGPLSGFRACEFDAIATLMVAFGLSGSRHLWIQHGRAQHRRCGGRCRGLGACEFDTIAFSAGLVGPLSWLRACEFDAIAISAGTCRAAVGVSSRVHSTRSRSAQALSGRSPGSALAN